MDYNLNLSSVVDKINSSKAKLVCVQLPEGLKPKAKEIQELVESKTKAQVVFWAGSCFGACDVPTHIDKLGFDLLFSWGHSGWK